MKIEALAHGVLTVRSLEKSVPFYIADPDGIEIEIMADADPQIWRDNPAAVATVEPLKL